MMDLDLVQTTVDNEFEDEDPATPEDVIKQYYEQFDEYARALRYLRLSTSRDTEAYGVLAKHEEKELRELRELVEAACEKYNIVLE